MAKLTHPCTTCRIWFPGMTALLQHLREVHD